MTILLTVIITILAYQLILFVMAGFTNDEEKVIIAGSCVWYFLWAVVGGGLYRLIGKIITIWFNRNYTYYHFCYKGLCVSGFYVKNGIALLQRDTSKDYYVEETDRKANNLCNYGLHKFFNNRLNVVIKDFNNPPKGYTSDYLKQFTKAVL